MTAYPKPTRIRLSGTKYSKLKKAVYKRDNGKCQVCGIWLPLSDGEVFNVFTCAHLSHIKSRGSGGEDTPENTEILCFKHHMEKHGW